MNRKYTRAQFIALVKRLREAIPDITLSTDILVGFPGETEDDIKDLLDLMEEIHFTDAFTYHYNPREGTKAASMPEQVPEPVQLERLSRVIALQKKLTGEYLESRIGKTVPALALEPSRKNPEEILCRLEHEEHLLAPAQGIKPGDVVNVKITGLAGNTLKGQKIN
jgi:tRNA-2-methylthio-N6-dimethylallyladenosine synthase